MDIKEILVLHHSHLDVGYTHTQPIVWELQREFIDHALEMLAETENWPHNSAPKWTIEVTAQVLKWLETASRDKIEKLKYFIAKGRVGISGLEFNTTPMCSAEQLVKQLEPVKKLRKLLNIEIKTVNQHDVDGVPWPAVDILQDAGIELLIMAVNIHLGGPIKNRPSVFKWRGPSGREIYVMNGAHYTMFDQLLYTWENSVERMKEGLEVYLEHLRKMNYNNDFIYLTTAAAPVCWDNSPPSTDVAKLIGEWNSRGMEPKIRYITPNELLERIKAQPEENIEVRTGDWTDYWNFGAASTADVTKTNTMAKAKLFKADMLNAFSPVSKSYYKTLAEQTWRHINLFDEHTWGSFNSMDPDNVFSKAQSNIKDHDAFEANEKAEYLLVDQLEEFTSNPKSCSTQQGIAAINLTGMTVKEYVRVPDWWHLEGKRLRTSRFGWETRYNQPKNAPLYGPVELEPYSYKFVSFNDLPKAETDESLKEGEITEDSVARRLNILELEREKTATKFIESEFYRLEFNPVNLRISRVYDKINKRDILNDEHSYTFFQFVREKTDPLFRDDRRAYYSRELEKEQFDISCWKTDWKKVYETASKPLGYEIEKTPEGISVTLSFEAPGVENLKQKIMLNAKRPLISLKASFYKKEVRTPESVYFVFPLKLGKNWKCSFDTAGVPTELDTEQLEGSSRDWFTVESYAAMYDKSFGAALFCPDAPMVQAGDFNFGRRSKSIERKENPVLLAWPMNNYWDTNFRPSQPGFVELEYHLTTFNKFNPALVKTEGDSLKVRSEVHPAMSLPEKRSGKFFEISNDSVHVLYARKSADENSILFRLINYSGKPETAALTLSGEKYKKAELVDLMENVIKDLQVMDNRVELTLDSRKVVSLKFTTEN
ncbi:MAG: glycosyl hydrolase-related protein [Syntrophomonadaceae bacterium]